MIIGIPMEGVGEARVAATPKTVAQLIKLGFEVVVESGAGVAAGFDDAAYDAAGAKLENHENVLAKPVIYKLNPPTDAEIGQLQKDAVLVSFLQPAQNPERVEKLAKRGVTALAMEMVPRISRAQAMDALSSMANISGYRAVVEAANAFGRFFTGQITAAGKVPPAEVMVIGAGVAGLAAIGTAKSLGAIVKAFDTREEVAEQIESMGGQFLRMDYKEEDDPDAVNDGYAKVMSKAFIEAEMALFAEQAKQVDIIITTAAIPGKPSPKLITKAMVESMKRGSVIVDLAAAGGGNCELTVPGEKIVTDNGVTIIGYTDMANRLAGQSSQLYSTNLVNLSKLLCPNKDGTVNVNFEDVILRNMTVCKAGEITFPPPPISVSQAPKAAPAKTEEKPAEAAAEGKKCGKRGLGKYILAAVTVILAIALGNAPTPFVQHMMVFALSVVIGYYVVWNVSHSLHTPLMSVTNAISGIVILGALLQIGHGHGVVSFLSFVAITLASVNVFGGFYVTRRMLNMFRK